MKIRMLALAALAMAGNAWAGEGHDGSAHTHWWLELKPSWYAGASLGQSSFGDWDGIANLNDGSFTSATEDDSDSAWRVFAGADLARYVAIEIGYADFGGATGEAQSDGSGGSWVAGPQSVSMEVQAWDLTVVGKLPVTTDLALLGKVGASHWDSTSRFSGNFQCCGPSVFEFADDNNTDWWYGAGVQYDGLRPLRVVGEYAVQPFNNGVLLLDSEIAAMRLSLAYLF